MKTLIAALLTAGAVAAEPPREEFMQGDVLQAESQTASSRNTVRSRFVEDVEKVRRFGITSLAGKDVGEAIPGQQFARYGVDVFGLNVLDCFAEDNAMMVLYRHKAVRCWSIEKSDHGSANCGCDVHGTSIVRNKDGQACECSRKFGNREVIYDQ